MNKLYWLHDNKANIDFMPFFASNKDVALRTLAGQLRDIREKNLYTAISVWEDSKLMEFDMDSKVIIEIPEFKEFFKKVLPK